VAHILAKHGLGYILGNFFTNLSGTDVVILKVFLPKIVAFFAQNTVSFTKNRIITLVF
jgi:hypothetical protein